MHCVYNSTVIIGAPGPGTEPCGTQTNIIPKVFFPQSISKWIFSQKTQHRFLTYCEIDTLNIQYKLFLL